MSADDGHRPVVARMTQHSAEKAWSDRHGDVWRLGDDGLMHTRETAPFPREHVERKWGPLRLLSACVCGDCYHPIIGPNTDGEACDWCQECGCHRLDHPSDSPGSVES